MTTIANGPNPLASMLDNAFSKLDRDKDGKLDGEEFQSFYEVLKAGVAVDDKGRPTVSAQDFRDRMDTDADGSVTLTEMQATGVLMPAELTDESLHPMVDYLLAQATGNAALAASRLLEADSTLAGEGAAS